MDDSAGFYRRRHGFCAKCNNVRISKWYCQECLNKKRHYKRTSKPRSDIFWTDAELQYLRDYYDKLTYKEISIFIDRSEKAVRNQIQRMGLRKQPGWRGIPRAQRIEMGLCYDGGCPNNRINKWYCEYHREQRRIYKQQQRKLRSGSSS